MAEEKLIFEKPYYRVEMERGQRGSYGWTIRASGPDLKQIKKEVKETNQWLLELEKTLREEIWALKDKKEV